MLDGSGSVYEETLWSWKNISPHFHGFKSFYLPEYEKVVFGTPPIYLYLCTYVYVCTVYKTEINGRGDSLR
jgi:hypothetical protein